jgi:hypothetical protein
MSTSTYVPASQTDLDLYVLQSFAVPCLAPSRPEGLAWPEVEPASDSPMIQ